jgi:NADPH-dependent 2,4-dienoyl-CoA reductase/sulfur reductase-like enzyme/rhodanese-related sulfurtransferase
LTENQKIVVIGANAAGLRAGARAKRLLPNASITVIDHGRYISYGACGMPYVVSGDIEYADELRRTAYGVIRDADFFRSAKGLEVIIQTDVEKIDREAKKIICKSLITGETSEYSYDKLVIATGSNPIIIPGVPTGSKRISTFKTFEDALAIQEAFQKGQIEKIGLIGAGPIGCELAEAAGAMWGAEAILIDAAPNILPAMLDVEMARPIENYLRSEDVKIYTDCPLEGITETEDGLVIKTPKGEFEVNHAVIAVGVRPNTKLAADCGLELGKGGGIVVDEKMTTSDPDIFAAGDCAELKHLITGKPIQLPLGSLANRQGRVIGSNLGGGDERFGPVVGSAAVKIFDMNVASTGLTEKAAKDAGFDVGVAWGTATDIADYYPDKQNLFLKLVYDKGTTKLLGLQGYSQGEVVKRIDVFAALLKHDGKLEDLLDAEFAYAPPYAPAVDPLYSIGCTARNDLLEGLKALPPDASIDDKLVVDVRRTQEAADRPLPEESCQNIPFETFRDCCADVSKDKEVVVVCSKGVRSSEAARILKQAGCADVSYVGGGSLMKLGQ